MQKAVIDSAELLIRYFFQQVRGSATQITRTGLNFFNLPYMQIHLLVSGGCNLVIVLKRSLQIVTKSLKLILEQAVVIQKQIQFL